MSEKSFEQGEIDPVQQALEARGFAGMTDMTDPVIPDEFGNVDVGTPEVLDIATEKARRSAIEATEIDTWENEGGRTIGE